MYKDYNMTQLTLPMETSVLIPTNDMSRHVNEIVETIPESEFDEFKHHLGATSCHPKMMLKIILYAYTQSVFSGRKIEKLLNDSIRMMWLSQNQTPSYKTINRFRVNPKALYYELVKEKIIPKIKEDNDHELTQEEIDLIGTHLDKEIEDLNHYIEHEKCTRLRKQIRQKRTEIKRYKKKFADYSERKYKYKKQNSYTPR